VNKVESFRNHRGSWVKPTASNLSSAIKNWVDDEGLRPRAAIRRAGIDELNEYALPRIRQIGEDRLTVHGAQDIVEEWAQKEGYGW
jgi:hypothetical protein